MSIAMARTVFEVRVDDATLAALAEMKSAFGVKSTAEVIRKALALARVATQYADSDNSITFLSGPNEERQRVLLSS